jgi:hypothetical protein
VAERGSAGKATFDRVKELTDDGKTRSDAFKMVAEESGRMPATVATAFYRVARQMPDAGGVKLRPRKNATPPAVGSPRRGRGGRSRAAATSRPTPPSPRVDALIADVHRAIDALGSHVRGLESDVQGRPRAPRSDRPDPASAQRLSGRVRESAPSGL